MEIESSLRILLLEDDKKFARRMRAAFKGQGVSVSHVTNVAQAMSTLTEKPDSYPDVAVVDVKLANQENGLDFVKAARDVHASFPIIVLSNHSQDEIEYHGNTLSESGLISLGVTEYKKKQDLFRDKLGYGEFLALLRALAVQIETTLDGVDVVDRRVQGMLAGHLRTSMKAVIHDCDELKGDLGDDGKKRLDKIINHAWACIEIEKVRTNYLDVKRSKRLFYFTNYEHANVGRSRVEFGAGDTTKVYLRLMSFVFRSVAEVTSHPVRSWQEIKIAAKRAVDSLDKAT